MLAVAPAGQAAAGRRSRETYPIPYTLYKSCHVSVTDACGAHRHARSAPVTSPVCTPDAPCLHLSVQALGVDADAVAETVQSNYMSFLPLLPEVPGGSRHAWEAQAPLPVQQARRCPAPWQHAQGVSVWFHGARALLHV